MTVKAIYEDGVLKPKGPLPFKEHEEVEIDIRSGADVVIEGDADALSFVGFIKSAPRGLPIAQDQDK